MNALSQNTKITVSDINTLISELNGKLNLSGGTLNGSLVIKKGGITVEYEVTSLTDAETLGIYGGSTWRSGSYAEFNGPNHPEYPNYVYIHSDAGDLIGSDTRWSIDDKTIIRSVNNVTASNDGNVNDISEIGSNFIRYTNGLQICFSTVYNKNNDASTRWTFPKAFKNPPTVTATIIGGDGANLHNFSEKLVSNSTTAISIQLCSFGDWYNTTSWGVHMIAVGIWK